MGKEKISKKTVYYVLRKQLMFYKVKNIYLMTTEMKTKF